MNPFKKRVVVKVGTNVMTNRDNRIVGPTLNKLVRQIAYLYEQDIITILVSSGSTIAGKEIIGDCSATDPSIRRQIFSSVGQPRMMRGYYSMFGRGGMASKLKIAKMMAQKGIPTYIANGKEDNVIIDIMEGKQVGTKFIKKNPEKHATVTDNG